MLGGLGAHSGGILAYFGMTSTPFGVFVRFTLNDFGPFSKEHVLIDFNDVMQRYGQIRKDPEGLRRI